MNKVGRNDPCPCGSGKKFKQCCGRESTHTPSSSPGQLIDVAKTFQAALTHQQAGRLRDAVTLLEKIVQAEPDHADALNLLGVIAHQLGKIDLAIELAEKAIRANPHNPHFNSNSGNMLYANGMLKEAAERFRQAISLQPDYAPAHHDLAIVLQAQGKPLEAIVSYRRAIDFNPGFADAHHNLGNALAEQRELRLAIESYKQAIQLKPQFAAAHNRLGMALEELGELDTAKDCYRKAIALDAEDAYAYFNLGHACQSQGKIDEAIESYRTALKLKADLGEARINAGILLQNIGRLAEAIDCFEQGITGPSGESWSIASLLLTAYWISGLNEKARHTVRQFKQVVESLEPNVLSKSDRGSLLFFLLIAALISNLDRQSQMYPTFEHAIPLNAFGESHCLIPSNATFTWQGDQVKGKSHLVIGIKMHHLAQPEANQYKACLATQLQNMPPASHLLFTIGEIDCRPDEGIWIACQKGAKPMDEIIAATVNGYLDWLSSQLAERQFRSVTIQGIPAPGYPLDGLIDLTDRAAFLDMIRSVNRRLTTETHRRGWRFLDVHAATTDGEGASNRRWHLDSHHVQPLLYAQAESWIR